MEQPPQVAIINQGEKVDDIENEIHNIDVTPRLEKLKLILQTINLWYEPIMQPKSQIEKIFKKLQKLIQTFAYITLSALLSTNIFQTVFNNKDLQHNLPNFTSELTVISRQIIGIYKLFIYNRNKTSILNLLEDTFSNIPVPICLNAQILKYKKHCLKIPFYVSSTSMFYHLMALPCILGFPIIASRVFDVTQSRPLFFYFLQSIMVLYILIIAFYITIFYVALASLTSTMLDHLADVINTLHDNSVDLKFNKLYQCRINATLRYIVQHQLRIHRFVSKINELYSLVMFLEVCSIQIVLTVFTFQIFSNQTITIYKACLYALAYFTLWILLLVLCWTGNEIKLKSYKIVQKCTSYSSWWSWEEYNMDIASCIIDYAKLDLRLRAGPFYTLTLKSFLAVLGVSFSHFVFLYQVYHS